MTWRFPKRPKYGATKIKSDGYWFDSKLEDAVYGLLKLRVKAKELSDLIVKPQVTLIEGNGERITHKVDFAAIENGQVVYFEAKGMGDPVWLLKKKLWKICAPGTLYVYTGSYNRIIGPELIVRAK